jgi:hypothetical protein
MRTTRLTVAALCAALSLTVAIPAAVGMPCQDLRTPDAVDRATPPANDVMPWQDLRTPDAQDAAFDALHR